MSALEDAKDFAWVVWVGVLALIAALLLSSMWLFGFGLFSQHTANFRGETSKRNQVEANGSFRIAAYDSFFNECASVQGIEGTITALEAERDGKPKPSTDRLDQIAAFIAANRATRAAAIAQYNADARKSYTSGQFRDSNLPFQLDPKAKETSCTA